MKKFVHKIAVTLLFTIAALITVHVLTALSTFRTRRAEQLFFGLKNEWGSTHLRVHDFEKWLQAAHKQPTGLILGTSTAYRNINPSILERYTGISWFNAGSLAQHPGTSKTLLEYAISKHKPDFLLLDIYAPLLGTISREADYDWIINGDNDDISLKLLAHNPDFRMVNEYLYRTLKRKIGGTQYYNIYPMNGTYHSNGFVCSDQHMPLSGYTGSRYYFDILGHPGVWQIDEIDALCSAHHIRLLVNIAPVIHQVNIVLPRTRIDYQVIDNGRFAQDDMIGLFYDSHHMTCRGSSIYSDSLGRKIASVISR